MLLVPSEVAGQPQEIVNSPQGGIHFFTDHGIPMSVGYMPGSAFSTGMPSGSLRIEFSRLDAIYRQTFLDEWGERLPDGSFTQTLDQIGPGDSVSFLFRHPGAEPHMTVRQTSYLTFPEAVGAAISRYLPNDTLVKQAANLIHSTTGNYPDILPLLAELNANSEQTLYFEELFIARDSRDGVAPLASLINGLCLGLAETHSPEAPMVFFTKGYRDGDFEAGITNKPLPVMNFATQFMTQIPTQAEGDNRFFFITTLKALTRVSQPDRSGRFTKAALYKNILIAKLFAKYHAKT